MAEKKTSTLLFEAAQAKAMASETTHGLIRDATEIIRDIEVRFTEHGQVRIHLIDRPENRVLLAPNDALKLADWIRRHVEAET